MEAIQSDLKSVLKLLRKIRAAQEDPTGEKSKARAANNGFNRSLEITSKLREFLGLEAEETISRSAVTRKINQYITANGLKHPDNGRMIILDNKLIDLLQPPDGVQVTFLNIQKYLSPHYIKTPKPDEPEPEPIIEPVPVEPPKKKVVRKVKPAAV